jgi:hypothetical protein
MSKWASFTCLIVLVLFMGKPRADQFSKYKYVESYEIRPGVLMIPTYSDDGEVCEIGLERKHYSYGQVEMDGGLDRNVIDRVIDELAPPHDRGPRAKEFPEGDLVNQSGHSVISSEAYENVLINIYADNSRACNRGEIVATIRWRNRKCQ